MNDDQNWLLRLAEIDPVLISSDIPKELEVRLVGRLSEYVEMMLNANIKFTRHDWRRLSRIERAAMSAAGKRWRLSQALKAGYSAQGRIEAAQVQSELDDGELLDQVILEEFVSGVHQLKKAVRDANR